jgi:hypothetical protein
MSVTVAQLLAGLVIDIGLNLSVRVPLGLASWKSNSIKGLGGRYTNRRLQLYHL